MTTKVVHCKREPYDVLIDRTTPWGNPYQIGPDGTREQVIAAYERYLIATPGLLNAVPLLRGKTLGCWCAPLACHGGVLARYADESAGWAPVQLCCNQRHFGPQCPDGLVMCCRCFSRFTIEQLSTDEAGDRIDVCRGCAAIEQVQREQQRAAQERQQ